VHSRSITWNLYISDPDESPACKSGKQIQTISPTLLKHIHRYPGIHIITLAWYVDTVYTNPLVDAASQLASRLMMRCYPPHLQLLPIIATNWWRLDPISFQHRCLVEMHFNYIPTNLGIVPGWLFIFMLDYAARFLMLWRITAVKSDAYYPRSKYLSLRTNLQTSTAIFPLS
jgi:hypothetical protein